MEKEFSEFSVSGPKMEASLPGRLTGIIYHLPCMRESAKAGPQPARQKAFLLTGRPTILYRGLRMTGGRGRSSRNAVYQLTAFKRETTHYDWCAAWLLPILFAVHPTGRYRSPRGCSPYQSFIADFPWSPVRKGFSFLHRGGCPDLPFSGPPLLWAQEPWF